MEKCLQSFELTKLNKAPVVWARTSQGISVYWKIGPGQSSTSAELSRMIDSSKALSLVGEGIGMLVFLSSPEWVGGGYDRRMKQIKVSMWDGERQLNLAGIGAIIDHELAHHAWYRLTRSERSKLRVAAKHEADKLGPLTEYERGTARFVSEVFAAASTHLFWNPDRLDVAPLTRSLVRRIWEGFGYSSQSLCKD